MLRRRIVIQPPARFAPELRHCLPHQRARFCPHLEPHPIALVALLSTSTARYDVVDKLRTLHADAVPHYWLVDPERGTLTVLRHSADAYLTVLTAGSGDVVRAEPFDAVEIPVARLLGVE